MWVPLANSILHPALHQGKEWCIYHILGKYRSSYLRVAFGLMDLMDFIIPVPLIRC